MSNSNHPGPAEIAAFATAAKDIARDIELEQLQAENEKLRGALEPFAEFARAASFDRLPDDLPMTRGSWFARRQVTAGDFKRALAALTREE